MAWAAIPPRLGYAYFYKPPSDGTSARFLAHHFQLIILTHGDEAYLAQLRHAGYGGPILQYVPLYEAEGPGPYVNAHARCDLAYPPYQRTVADRPGVFCRQIHPHESWFLHNRRGQRLYTRHRSANGIWRTVYEMNPASPGWRHFFTARLRQYRHLGFDGFFFDNVDLSRSGLLLQMADRGGLKEYPTGALFRTAVAGFLAALRAAFPGVPLWANLTHDPERAGAWASYLPYLNGVMVEDFALGWQSYPLAPEARRAQWHNIRQALGRGLAVLLVAQGARHDARRRRLALTLAWALTGSGGPVFFRYNSGSIDDYRQAWWCKLYTATPPAPRGPLQRSGLDWVRAYPGGRLRISLAPLQVTLPPRWARQWRKR
ncbi:MAG: putative glycoside hydrolase [Terriglobales bacterium]